MPSSLPSSPSLLRSHIKTDSDKRCAVSAYFKPSISKKSQKGSKPRHTAQFRGRSLVGYSHPLPSPLLGLILKPSTESTDDDHADSSDIIVDSSFKDVMLWGHDMAPAENDDVLDKARDFIEVMAALHGC
ncbi:hypothetical protein TL16_g11855 [Triparma laevis f. inornata]|uniref:Uncharacterized protein n=1 Tax=Triparma laevis f. inornata TaxID=1714386 RepID=A0A9W7BLJ8_9STRA|nr:hypothetical protein TL16_g11855 [Triparma laevis f. inornata]